MNDTVKPLNAKARLALSRAELLADMGYQMLESESGEAQQVVQLPKRNSATSERSWSSKISRSVVGRWWRRNPLSSVVELGRPFLEDYAQAHPARLVGIGAGTGAILWVLKPWRLLSVATVLTLLLKSSDISGLAMSFLGKSKKDELPS